MAQQEPTMPTTCDHCGKPFNTSAVHPRNYCSIACEEGRAPLPMSDPSSPDFHLHVKGEPRALVGKTLVANGLSLVDYSPDWCKGPNDWSHGVVTDVDVENQTYVRKDDVVLGKIVDYGADGYTVEHEDMETGELTTRTIHDFLMVEMLRKDRWWVDG